MDFIFCLHVIAYLHWYNSFLIYSQDDLVNTIGESAALGASGIVIWGDMNLTQSKVCQVNYYVIFLKSNKVKRTQKTITIIYIISSSLKVMTPYCKQVYCLH